MANCRQNKNEEEVKMRDAIRNYVEGTGLWSGGEEKYQFILSPDVYRMNRNQEKELAEIGPALYDCLAGIGRIGAIADNPKIAHGETWHMIGRVLRAGIPKQYLGIQLLHPGKTPAVCKVDLMETAEGYRIAEVDAHNKHGLGYSTLASGIKAIVLNGEVSNYPTVVGALAKEIKKRKEGVDVAVICAEQEKFYLRELSIFAKAMKKVGINIIVMPERLLELRDGLIGMKGYGPLPRLLMDFPFLFHSPGVSEKLTQMYVGGEIDFLITPKPFLGSKSIMALFRNDEDNPVLESILLSQISKQSLDVMRKYIPETYLVANSRGSRIEKELLKKCQNSKFVLKNSVSSGMKGVTFSSDPNFLAELSKACKSYYQFILQKEVESTSREFCHYSEENGEILSDKWFMRVTAHYSARSVADVVVTARRDKKVHGARDCLQLGAISCM